MRLFVDDNCLQRTRMGTISGLIYFETEKGFFPEKGWSDLVVAFTSAWIEALIRIASNSKSEQVWFIDGPYAVDLSISDLGMVEARFVHDQLKGKSLLQSSSATKEHLFSNAITIAGTVLTACSQKGWSDNDTEALAVSTKQATEILSAIRSRS